MNREQIIECFKTLSAAQGFYGRVYRKVTDGSEESEKFLEKCVKQNFKDVVDLILYVES